MKLAEGTLKGRRKSVSGAVPGRDKGDRWFDGALDRTFDQNDEVVFQVLTKTSFDVTLAIPNLYLEGAVLATLWKATGLGVPR
jgi:hypothetical protein